MPHKLTITIVIITVIHLLAVASATPYGMFGNIFDRFMFGTDPLPLPTYSKPHALQAAETAISPDVPFGVLQRANTIWRSNNAGETYGGNYKEMDPLTTVTKKLGRLVCVANGEHLLHAMEKIWTANQFCWTREHTTTRRLAIQLITDMRVTQPCVPKREDIQT